MALTDINFQAGEGQDFIIEIPNTTFTGNLADVLAESNSSQFLLLEIPLVTGGGNIFIMSE